MRITSHEVPVSDDDFVMMFPDGEILTLVFKNNDIVYLMVRSDFPELVPHQMHWREEGGDAGGIGDMDFVGALEFEHGYGFLFVS